MDLFRQPLKPINVGLESFYESMVSQGRRPSLWTGGRRSRATSRCCAHATGSTSRRPTPRPSRASPRAARCSSAWAWHSDVIPGFAPAHGADADHAQRAADRVGAHVRPDARRSHGRADLRRAGRDARRRPRPWPRPARSSSHPAITTARSGRWRASSAHRCRCSSSRTRHSATSPTPRRTRGWARCCATARTGPEVIRRLKWMETVLYPALKAALEVSGPIDLRSMTAQALHMGDECHNRNKAGTSLFIRLIAPALVEAVKDRGSRCRGAALHRRQRPLLSESLDAGDEGNAGCPPKTSPAARS